MVKYPKTRLYIKVHVTESIKTQIFEIKCCIQGKFLKTKNLCLIKFAEWILNLYDSLGWGYHA